MITFEINKNEWDLEVVDPEQMNGNLGITIFSDYKILLMKGKPSNMRSALIHEVTHAFRWSYGSIVSDQNKISIAALDIEEIIANTIEAHGEAIFEVVNELWPLIEEELEEENE